MVMVTAMVKNLRLTLWESVLTGCGCSGGLREARQGVQNLGKSTSAVSLSMSSKHVKSKLSVLLLITYNHCHSRASRECLQITPWRHTIKKATINAYLSKVWIVVEHRRLEKICFPHVIKPEEVEESKYCDDIIVLIALLLKICLLLCAWCKEESDVLEAKKLCQRWTLVNLIRKVKVVVVRWTMKSESVDSYAEKEKWKW